MSIDLHVPATNGSIERRYRGFPLASEFPSFFPVTGSNALAGAEPYLGSPFKNLDIQVCFYPSHAQTLPILAHPSTYTPNARTGPGAVEDTASQNSCYSDTVLSDVLVKKEHDPNFSTCPSSPISRSIGSQKGASTSPCPSSDTGTGSDNIAETIIQPNIDPIAAPVKRQRGRPRKGTIVVVAATYSPQNKTKGKRTKTGCLTCRQRKKKCDERKPICSTCESNNYECEFPAKKIYMPGVKKSQSVSKNETTKELLMLPSELPRALPSVNPGVETDLDKQLVSHFRHVVCRVVTCNARNPYLYLILPQAFFDEGTMHALLSLSSAHYYRSVPHEEVRMCKQRHQQKASAMVENDFLDAFEKTADVHDGVVAGLILLYELCLIDNDFEGEYKRRHLQAQRYLVFRDAEPLQRFARDYFEYRHMALTMTSYLRDQKDLPSQTGLESSYFLPPLLHRASSCSFTPEDLRFAVPETVIDCAYDGVMRTVLGGLFPLISDITLLRDGVRVTPLANQTPSSRLRFFERGNELEGSLGQWDSKQDAGTAWWVLAELYRAAAFVYLFRTINDPRPCQNLSESVERGICFLNKLRSHSKSTDCVLLLPTFILGCAAFAAHERDSIEKVMKALAECNNFSNVEPSMEVLRKLWVMMDEGDKRNWDWETIREGLKDFPLT